MQTVSVNVVYLSCNSILTSYTFSFHKGNAKREVD